MSYDSLFEDAVNAAYEAAFSQDYYRELAGLLRGGLSAGYVGLTIVHRRPNLSLSIPFADGLCRSDLELYERKYAAIDPILPPSLRLSAGTCIPLVALLPRSELFASDYYAEFLSHTGLFDCIGGVIENSDSLWASLTVYFGVKSEVDLPQETQFVRRLLPHVRRAVKIHHHLLALGVERDEQSAVFDALAVAVFVVSAAGNVLRANHAAEALLRRQQSTLRVRQGRIEAGTPRLTRELRNFIGRAVRRDGSLPDYFFLPRQGHAPLVVNAVSSPPRHAEFLHVQAGAVVFIHDPERMERTPAQLLIAAFNLTGAEARLAAALASGATLDAYAASTQVTRHTVRTQLKRAMAKLGVRRQAELVALVLRLVGYLRRE